MYSAPVEDGIRGSQPRIKSYDKKGNTLLCTSVSSSLYPDFSAFAKSNIGCPKLYKQAINVYVAGNRGNPAFPEMPRQLQNKIT